MQNPRDGGASRGLAGLERLILFLSTLSVILALAVLAILTLRSERSIHERSWTKTTDVSESQRERQSTERINRGPALLHSETAGRSGGALPEGPGVE